MSRIIGTALAASVFLAGCGGGGAAPSAPGLPGGDYKGKMPDLIKPCDTANKLTTQSLPNFKSGKATLNETKVIADAGVAACQAADTAWRGLGMPAPVADACLAQSAAKLGLAQAMRSGLDHQMSKPYKTRVDRMVLEV